MGYQPCTGLPRGATPVSKFDTRLPAGVDMPPSQASPESPIHGPFRRLATKWRRAPDRGKSWHAARNLELDPSVNLRGQGRIGGQISCSGRHFRPSRSVAFLVLPRQITAPLGAVFLHPAIKAISRFLDFHYSW